MSKIDQNDRKMTKNGQKWSKMVKNGQNMFNNDKK